MANTIKIIGHGLGEAGTIVNLLPSTTGTLPTGLESTPNKWLVVDEDTLSCITSSFTDIGTGVLTLSTNTSSGITNSTAIGYNSQPDASNQIMLGDSNIESVKTTGVIYASGGNSDIWNSSISLSIFQTHTGDTTIHFTLESIENNFLSADTSFYTQLEVDSNFLSANTFIPTDFYSTAEADANFLSADTSFYTQLEVDSNFLSANTFIPTDFYSTAEADANFLSADTSFYTEAQADANFLSADTSFYTEAQSDANFLSANTGYVDLTTNQDINGDKTFIDNILIGGNLTVSGTTTYINTTDMNVKDNLITINSGETGSGVSKLFAGIEVDRGLLTNYIFVFDEIQDNFRIGESGTPTGGTQAVATREDNPTNSGISFWIESENRFITSPNLIWNGENIVGYYTEDQVDANFLSANTTASEILMERLGTTTYESVQDLSDITQSAGVISGGTITDAGSGSIDISAIRGIIKSVNSDIGSNLFFDLEAQSALTLTNNSINFIAVDYNSGAPKINITTTKAANGHTIFNLGKVYREDTDLDIIDSGLNIYDLSKRIQQHNIEQNNLHFVSGAVVSETGTRNISITAGIMYAGLNRILTNYIDTNLGDNFEYYYFNGTVWIETDETQIDNLQYNNITTGLSTLSNNKYGVHWVYKGTNSSTYVLYGQGNYTLSKAESVQPPSSIPSHVYEMGVLRAKIIIEKSDSTFTEIQNVSDVSFQAGVSSNHNELSGLQGGIANQYYHLSLEEATNVSNLASNFLSANTSYYTQLQADANFLSANTSYYTQSQADSNFLSANTFIPTDFYSTAEADANFLSANTFIPTDFYSTAEADANFLSANTSFYTQSEADANFLSANTSYYTQSEVYNTGETYTKAQIDIIAASGVTEFADDTFKIYNTIDDTKVARFETSGISSGEELTFIFPSSGGTLALTSQLSGGAITNLDGGSSSSIYIGVGLSPIDGGTASS